MNLTICQWMLLVFVIRLGSGGVVHAAEQQEVGKPENERLAAIERNVGGRLGVAILDTGNSSGLEYRASERFPMCSTFKLLAAAAVLHRVDVDQERLDRRISYGQADLLTWAPVTKEHVNEGSMTLSDICAAAIDYSDNTAANLILKSIGGPEGLTGYLRSLGDPITRLDRIEPELNTALEGDERDTTTPASMLYDIQVLLLGDKLSAASRQQLETWLVANKTGDKRLRAGLPKDWRVGDKTGTGDNGALGDVAIVRPPNRGPILVVVYTHGSSEPLEKLNDAFAAVGKLVADTF
jgi:beta-lactamase class A